MKPALLSILSYYTTILLSILSYYTNLKQIRQAANCKQQLNGQLITCLIRFIFELVNSQNCLDNIKIRGIFSTAKIEGFWEGKTSFCIGSMVTMITSCLNFIMQNTA